jgi:hypothetical protein
MPRLRALCSKVLGLMFLASGALKSIDATAPVMATAAYDMVPGWVALAVGALLPAFELVVGAALITGWQRRAAALWAVLLGVVFAIANTVALTRGLLVDCECFGGLGGTSPATALWIDLVVVGLGLAAARPRG